VCKVSAQSEDVMTKDIDIVDTDVCGEDLQCNIVSEYL
jgi:hypothetical protein